MKTIYRFLSNRKLLKNELIFKKIGKSMNIDFNFIFYDDLAYISGLGLYHIKKGKINDIDGAWITGNAGLDFKRSISYFFSNFNSKTKLIDSRNKKMLDDSKLSQLIFLDNNNYKIPKSFFCYIDMKWQQLLEKYINYPMIAKDINLDRGEGVFLINNINELKDFFKEKFNQPFLFQEFIVNKGDWRVLVVGKKVLGGFRRYNSEDFKNNFSQGGDIVFDEVPSILNKIAVNICKGFEIEIGGIDFFYENGEYYVIEINRTPQTNAFKKKYKYLYEKEVLEFFL